MGSGRICWLTVAKLVPVVLRRGPDGRGDRLTSSGAWVEVLRSGRGPSSLETHLGNLDQLA